MMNAFVSTVAWMSRLCGVIAAGMLFLVFAYRSWRDAGEEDAEEIEHGQRRAFFNSFALTQWAQYRQIGRWRQYLTGERTYILLSLLAKSALAWQVFGGTLVPPA